MQPVYGVILGVNCPFSTAEVVLIWGLLSSPTSFLGVLPETTMETQQGPYKECSPSKRGLHEFPCYFGECILPQEENLAWFNHRKDMLASGGAGRSEHGERTGDLVSVHRAPVKHVRSPSPAPRP